MPPADDFSAAADAGSVQMPATMASAPKVPKHLPWLHCRAARRAWNERRRRRLPTNRIMEMTKLFMIWKGRGIHRVTFSRQPTAMFGRNGYIASQPSAEKSRQGRRGILGSAFASRGSGRIENWTDEPSLRKLQPKTTCIFPVQDRSRRSYRICPKTVKSLIRRVRADFAEQHGKNFSLWGHVTVPIAATRLAAPGRTRRLVAHVAGGPARHAGAARARAGPARRPALSWRRASGRRAVPLRGEQLH